MKIFGNFFLKKCQVFGNFLTVKWQFCGGSDMDALRRDLCRILITRCHNLASSSSWELSLWLVKKTCRYSKSISHNTKGYVLTTGFLGLSGALFISGGLPGTLFISGGLPGAFFISGGLSGGLSGLWGCIWNLLKKNKNTHI